MLEPLVVVARADADPADRLAVAVGDETRVAALGSGGIHGALQDAAVALGRSAREVDAPEAVVGARAPLGVAALVEQAGEIGQALARQREDLQGHRLILDR